MKKIADSKPLNKSELIQSFPMISPTAIQERDGEFVIIGKFCLIASLGGNRWDVWLCNPKNLIKGLSTRKLNVLLENLQQEAGFTVLVGEAYTKVQGTELIENNLDLMGIRKRRQITEERRKALVEQAGKLRERKYAA